MNISGGTFISEQSKAVLAYTWEKNQENEYKATDWEKAADQIDISGGTFSTDLSAEEYEGYLSDDVKYQVNHVAGNFSYAKTMDAAQALAQQGDSITDLKATETFTLTLDYNTGSATDKVTYDVGSGTTVTLPKPPARTNYTFGGWSDGTNTYNGGASYTVKATVTLTAQWIYNGGGSSSGGDDAVTYTLSVPKETTGGSVRVNSRNVSKNATVTITVTPDEGYELASLTVTDKNGKEIELTDKGDGKYTFKMPASKVTIQAAFQEIVVEPVNPFTDVFESDYYYDAVLWAVENGVTKGTNESGTLFSPHVTLTRAEMVTFLWRAAGCPEPTETEHPFVDVDSEAFYYDAMLWAVENGITNGTGDGTTFSPDATVTRCQAVTFQWRAAGCPEATGGSFEDVAADAWYTDAVTWAVDNGITIGTNQSGTLFSPEMDVSRAQAVTFLYRELAQ